MNGTQGGSLGVNDKSCNMDDITGKLQLEPVGTLTSLQSIGMT